MRLRRRGIAQWRNAAAGHTILPRLDLDRLKHANGSVLIQAAAKEQEAAVAEVIVERLRNRQGKVDIVSALGNGGLSLTQEARTRGIHISVQLDDRHL